MDLFSACAQFCLPDLTTSMEISFGLLSLSMSEQSEKKGHVKSDRLLIVTLLLIDT